MAQSTAVRRRTRAHTTQAREAYILLAPALILVGIFAAFPLVRSVWFAFNEANPFQGIVRFVGFDNFVAIFKNLNFGRYAGNTAFWTLGAVGLQLLLGLTAALADESAVRLARGVPGGSR